MSGTGKGRSSALLRERGVPDTLGDHLHRRMQLRRTARGDRINSIYASLWNTATTWASGWALWMGSGGYPALGKFLYPASGDGYCVATAPGNAKPRRRDRAALELPSYCAGACTPEVTVVVVEG